MLLVFIWIDIRVAMELSEAFDPDTWVTSVPLILYPHAVWTCAAPVQATRLNFLVVLRAVVHQGGDRGQWRRGRLTNNALRCVGARSRRIYGLGWPIYETFRRHWKKLTAPFCSLYIEAEWHTNSSQIRFVSIRGPFGRRLSRRYSVYRLKKYNRIRHISLKAQKKII